MSQVVEWVGSFAMVEAPEWWDSELARIWPEKGAGPGDDFSIGRANFETVQGHRLEEGRGWIVTLSDGISFDQLVLCRTDAAFLDLMTSRGAAWANLSTFGRSIGESLEHIRNAAISIARWGVNNRDVSLWTGVDRTDQGKPDRSEF